MNAMDVFNNREIATFVWLVVFAVFVLRSKDVRKSAVNVLKIMASPKLLLPVVLLAAYISGFVYLLHKVGLWNIALLKDTLFWFFSAGLLTMGKYVTAKVPVKKILYENLKIVVVLEFILNMFTFALWMELLIVPVVTIIVMMNTYVEATKGDRRVAKLLAGILQAILGFVLIGHAFYAAVADYRVLGTLDTMRSFLLPILLSTAIVPAAYLMAVYSNCESLFIGFKFGSKKAPWFIWYCKWQVILHCGVSTKRIARLRPFDLMHLESKQDVKDMLIRRDEVALEEVIDT